MSDKAARGAQPLPVERCLRDARALRVAGGVDVMMDRWSAESNLPVSYEADLPSRTWGDGDRDYVEAQAVRLAKTGRALAERLSRPELFARQRTTALIGRIGSELLGMAVVLARSAVAPDLADAACEAARRRVDGLWSDLSAELATDAGAAARVGERCLADADDHGIEAVVTDIWCDLFDVRVIEPDADFFSLGGHSMIAVRMAARLRERLGLRVPVRLIMENPTVPGLTRCLAEA
ncbi:acyl carrier protein [Kibdelosporangium phytohabitans]|uniref:Carrier domain-containing protein n=1 Tax=Kibdelosporangium phytohabitans TaxID=860235 RepID=A0A0N9I7Q3_9PSEU|nr:acyl carrier protein [Kibdelosporangium phytohabitans]ALG10539.1 hypothetical protein AOZ06_29855 [Kibdelosporangium phytohabitans]MBE1461637.1 acyl carrier protein [Kibdelosporangium phytohabitans]